MHGEEEKVGSCRGAVEITVPIIITACFLNTVAYFPLPTLAPHFCSGREIRPLLGK